MFMQQMPVRGDDIVLIGNKGPSRSMHPALSSKADKYTNPAGLLTYSPLWMSSHAMKHSD